MKFNCYQLSVHPPKNAPTQNDTPSSQARLRTAHAGYSKKHFSSMSNSTPRPSPSRRSAPPTIDAVWITRQTLTYDLTDGRSISVPLSFYPALAASAENERNQYEVHGDTVYWSALRLKLKAGDLLSGRKVPPLKKAAKTPSVSTLTSGGGPSRANRGTKGSGIG